MSAILIDTETTGVDEPEVIELARTRFESMIERIPESGCWIWLGGARKGGDSYGRWCCRSVSREERYAHRFAYILYRGPIPSGLDVCHRCDVPTCVNPSHLFLGTPAHNTADMVTKGRARGNPDSRGERNGRAKLTAEQVAEIRASTLPGTVLGPRYGVSSTMIYYIRKRQNWRTEAA